MQDCIAKGWNCDDAQDIVQTAIIELSDKVNAFSGNEQALYSWFRQAVSFVGMRWGNDRGRWHHVPVQRESDDSDERCEHPTLIHDPRLVTRVDQRNALTKALAQVPPDIRWAIEALADGATWGEIGERLGLSVHRAKALVNKHRVKLQHMLNEFAPGRSKIDTGQIVA